jgi:hypothetical protein
MVRLLESFGFFFWQNLVFFFVIFVVATVEQRFNELCVVYQSDIYGTPTIQKT